MAKSPTTDHAKAVSAFINGWITREEYQMCCNGEAWISGRAIWLNNGWSWSPYVFTYHGKVSHK